MEEDRAFTKAPPVFPSNNSANENDLSPANSAANRVPADPPAAPSQPPLEKPKSNMFLIIALGALLLLAGTAGIGFWIYRTVFSPKVGFESPFASPSPAQYSCPTVEWVDCMPKIDASPDPACSSQYLEWAKNNCPNFKGVAY